MGNSLQRVLLLLAGGFALLPLPCARGADDISSFTGYTRPGAPNDYRKEGAVVFIADDPVQKKEAIGGSLYFVVLQRPENGEWDANVKAMAARFRAGLDSTGGSSVALDLSARYLYLFQLVNDRGTLLPIQSAALNLQVDLKKKEVTSWGSFPTFGFGAGKVTDPEKPAGPILAVSSSHRDGAGPGELLYRSPSPFVPATQPYRIKRIATKGDKPLPPGPGVAKIEWDPIDPALEPDHVILVARADKQGPAFRAVWSGDNALQKGNRSTLFGYTSNLPPTYDAVRIQAPGGAGSGVRPAGAGGERQRGRQRTQLRADFVVHQADAGGREPDAGGKMIAAEGQAPTPRPEAKVQKTEATPASAEGPPPPPPLVPPMLAPALSLPGVASAGGTSSNPPASSAATTASGSSSGGASAGGGGSTSSQQAAQTRQQQQQQQATPLSLLQQITIVVQQKVIQNTTVTQSQDQSQAQAQAQQQQQSQQQSQTQGQTQNQGGTVIEVVPEPSTFIAGALALTFLLLRLRREEEPAKLAAQ